MEDQILEQKLKEEISWKLSPTISHFSALMNENYSLDHLYLLGIASQGIDIKMLQGKKIKALVQTLERKFLIDKDGQITLDGFRILDFKFNAPEIRTTEMVLSRFDEWWSIYPPTDGFEYKGKKFDRTRALRISKDDCKRKFDNIITKGAYTADQIIDATKIDIDTRKRTSISTNSNKLTFLQNSATYLNQLSFDPFIELIGIKEVKDTIKSQIKSIIDI